VCVRACMCGYVLKESAVLAVLLHRAKTWTLEANDVRYLTVFHHYCDHLTIGI